MGTILGRVAKAGKHLRPLEPVEIESRLPWYPAATEYERTWRDPSGMVDLQVFASESPDDALAPLLDVSRIGAAAWTGYLHSPPAEASEGRGRGCFALVEASEGMLRGTTAIHRMEPLYMVEGPSAYAISTSARLAATAAEQKSESVPPSVLVNLAGPGFMLSDETPYAGVTAVPANTSVEVRPEGISLRELPAPDIAPDGDLDYFADRVSAALVEAAQAIAREPYELRCHITGGKDSRVALAALWAVGAECIATSSGFPQHPDVWIGQRIARMLGFEHSTRAPTTNQQGSNEVIEVDLDQRAFNALRSSEGMITAYESFSPPGVSGKSSEASKREVVTAGGHGGELLRGGFSYRLRNLTVTEALRRLDLVAAPHKGLLTDDGRVVLAEMLTPWQGLISENPGRGLEQFYRNFRAGRWHAVARPAYSRQGRLRTILADNVAVRLASSMDQLNTWNERLMHSTLLRLHPDLAEVPFFKSRWNFEKSGPVPYFRPESWPSRAPVLDSRGRETFNWRIHYSKGAHEHMREVILSSRSDFFRFLSRPHVEDYLSATAKARTGAEAKLVWSLFSAAQLLEGLHERTDPPAASPQYIALPSG